MKDRVLERNEPVVEHRDQSGKDLRVFGRRLAKGPTTS
jgi:hypothetical protein